MMGKNNDLFDFMKAITSDMASEYRRIQKRAVEDPGTAGDQGEENWATLLREWLPPIYHVVTKGRILSIGGDATPQVDVLVLSPAYPRALLNKKLFLAGGVVAAFECKTTLKTQHISQAIQNAATIRRLLPIRYGSPYLELHSPIFYGLLAHSHSWKRAGSQPLERISGQVYEDDRTQVLHPREMLDMICIADLATWTAARTTFIGPKQVPDWTNLVKIYGEYGSAATAYMCYSDKQLGQVTDSTPIGAAITYLMRRLAWETDTVRPLADYFFNTRIAGFGGGTMRIWSSDIYSEIIKPRIMSGQLGNRLTWDEWSLGFF